jgi:hypothetical protein
MEVSYRANKAHDRAHVSSRSPQDVNLGARIECFGLDADGHRLSPR